MSKEGGMITKSGVDLNVCAYCKSTIDDYSRTVDHLFPKSRGGKLSNNNKVPCCGQCNKLKGSMSITEFSRALEGLIFYEHERHKESISRLKKIKMNVSTIITERLGNKDK
jgi:5-methylcytosine-specific restriction endonuclease McrA